MAFATPQQTWTPLYFVAVLFYFGLASLGTCQSTPAPPAPCSTNTDCGSCVSNPKCLWCLTSKNCTDYPVSWLLPPSSVCQLSEARWGVCWLNFEALIITLAVLGGVLILSIIVCCCCCCCCCCKSRPSGPDRDEERLSRRREEMKQRAEERKAERRARNDDIRRKYGLMSDAEHPYSKLENE